MNGSRRRMRSTPRTLLVLLALLLAAAAPAPAEAADGSGFVRGADAEAGALPEGTPLEQYDYALGLMHEAKYEEAGQALRAFIARYPEGPLTGNAQYWLGETLYLRQDYSGAAAVFAGGYQRYPTSSKAADNLLMLGLALGELDRKADACRALAKLKRDFPGAPAALKDRAREEKKHLRC